MTKKEKKVFHKRKKLNLKVKQDFQIWLLVRIMGTVLLTISLASVILYFYALTVVDTDYLSFSPEIRKVSDVLLPILLAASLSSIVLGLLLALFLPQKIAGPIFRIEQDLLQIRTGDLTKVITLRYADVLKELAQSVNMALPDIRNMINDVKETNSDLEAKTIQGDISEIRKALEKQKKCLEQFTT
jgi:methyl-accepting chemotaxis protein